MEMVPQFSHFLQRMSREFCTKYVFSIEKSAFEYGLVNQALSSAMRTLIKVCKVVTTNSLSTVVMLWVCILQLTKVPNITALRHTKPTIITPLVTSNKITHSSYSLHILMYNISVFMMHLLRYRSELTKTHTAMVAPCQPPEQVIGNI